MTPKELNEALHLARGPKFCLHKPKWFKNGIIACSICGDLVDLAPESVLVAVMPNYFYSLEDMKAVENDFTAVQRERYAATLHGLMQLRGGVNSTEDAPAHIRAHAALQVLEEKT